MWRRKTDRQSFAGCRAVLDRQFIHVEDMRTVDETDFPEVHSRMYERALGLC